MVCLLCHRFLLLVLLFLCTSPAESTDPSGQFCNTNTNISNNQISANIDYLLPQLVKGTILNGYINTSYGKAKNQVYGLSQCRADVSNEDCSSCIQDAATEIRTRCPNQADARIWYEYCFLRYDINNFFGHVDTAFGIYIYNVEDANDPDTFNKELGALLDQITTQAVVPGNRGNGRAKNKYTPFLTIYALVQCTRDLSPLSCSQCLSIAVGNIPNYCNNKKGVGFCIVVVISDMNSILFTSLLIRKKARPMLQWPIMCLWFPNLKSLSLACQMCLRCQKECTSSE